MLKTQQKYGDVVKARGLRGPVHFNCLFSSYSSSLGWSKALFSLVRPQLTPET